MGLQYVAASPKLVGVGEEVPNRWEETKCSQSAVTFRDTRQSPKRF